MSLVLNTNLNSLIAQNSLADSGMQLSTALPQLSSGLRINTAADDAAGYAIVQGMTSQINGLNQAARNAADGVSLSQTASGALSEIISDLQTMRDLAVQSLNATNSAQDRVNLDQQFQQLMADINNVGADRLVQRREPARRLVPGRDLPGRRQCRQHHHGGLGRRRACLRTSASSTAIGAARLRSGTHRCRRQVHAQLHRQRRQRIQFVRDHAHRQCQPPT